MTPATFATLREANGLPIPWLAAQLGVAERTVRYWATGRLAVPNDAAQLVQRLNVTGVAAAQKAARLIDRQLSKTDGPFEPVVLVRYRTDRDLWRYRRDLDGLPAAYHGSIIARVMLLCEHLPAEVVTEWLDAEPYEAWLKATKQKDCETLRAQFVIMN